MSEAEIVQTDIVTRDGVEVSRRNIRADGTGEDTFYGLDGEEVLEVVPLVGLVPQTLAEPEHVDAPLPADVLASAAAARTAAYDGVLASYGNVLSMSCLREADRSGWEAFLAVLAGG